jgi:hypothetical protein
VLASNGHLHTFDGSAWVDNGVTVSNAAPLNVGAASAAGAAGAPARADHVHAHGAQTVPTHHALATEVDSGFFSGLQKQRLDLAAMFAGTPIAASNGNPREPLIKTVEYSLVFPCDGVTTKFFIPIGFWFSEVPGISAVEISKDNGASWSPLLLGPDYNHLGRAFAPASVSDLRIGIYTPTAISAPWILRLQWQERILDVPAPRPMSAYLDGPTIDWAANNYWNANNTSHGYAPTPPNAVWVPELPIAETVLELWRWVRKPGGKHYPNGLPARRAGKRFVPYARGTFNSTGSNWLAHVSDIGGGLGTPAAFKACYLHVPTGARSALSDSTIRRTAFIGTATSADRQGQPGGPNQTRGHQLWIDR